MYFQVKFVAKLIKFLNTSAVSPISLCGGSVLVFASCVILRSRFYSLKGVLISWILSRKGGLIPYLCVVDVAEKGRSPVVQEHRIVVAYGHPLKLALVSRVCLVLTTRADRCLSREECHSIAEYKANRDTAK